MMSAFDQACEEIHDWHFNASMEKLNTPTVYHLIY